MTPRLRIGLLGLAGLCLLPAIWKVAAALPPFGEPTAQYGPAVNRLGPELRHVSNMVSAVNFDFRGFDTLGEEFMLVCAVTGAAMLLRGARGEDLSARAGRVEGRAVIGRAESTILISRLFGPATLLFGLYMALHATVTPGGGFQGGVVIASGLLLTYLGEGYRGWRQLIGSRVLDAIEGGGALLFALAGFAPMAFGRAYMQNILPLGTFKDVFSGGLMLVENAGVALAVTGGFAMLFLEFMEETRALESESGG
ncbi:MAG TPA: MnhB domain-containing protein [Stellaceae bacterium]|jgi:multicomponent Na+:H+ antiporter subunit B